MDNLTLKKAASAGAAPAGLIATAVGFFCDFVKPFINLVPYFFFFSLLIAAGIWFFVLNKKLRSEPLEQLLETKKGKIFGVSVISSAFWLVMIPIFALTPQAGIAATVSPDIAGLQDQILGKLTVIENKIDTGFDKVLAKIDQIDANAGLVGNPVTPNDFYHNAKIHELNGNLIEAKKSYEKYFESDMEYLDPYTSYALILKNLEGPSSGRELMSKMRDSNSESPSVNLAYIMMKDNREDRIALLEALAQKDPEYGPVYMAIADQYSYKEAGMPTNEERRKEREALQKVLDLEKDQKFSKFYIDKKESEAKLSWAQQELKLMEGTMGGMLDNPVDFRVEYVNNSVSISFIPTELIKKIFYRIDGEGEFKDTGSMGIAMAGQTDPLPNYQVMEAMKIGDHSIEMKYIDMKGKESPVYTHKFTIEPLKIQPNPYKMVDAKTGKDQYMVFWSAFDGTKEYEYIYSLDDKSLNKKVEYGTLNLTDLAKGKHTIYLQGISGGEKTNVAEMEFEVN